MNEFIFVHLLDDQPVGSDLGLEIPMHTTLLHWFETERTPEEILNIARTVLRGIAPVETIVTYNDMFGPDKDIPVMRLKRSFEFLNLHLLLLESMIDANTTFDQRWVGVRNWNPYVTNKLYKKLSPGDRLEINSVSLIQKRRPDKHRIVLDNVILNS
jgi:hypothetical protein